MAFVRFVALAMCFLMAVSAPPAAFAQYSDSEPPLEPGGIPSPIMDEVKMGNLDAYAFIPFVDDYGRMFDVTVYFASSTARVKGPGLDQTAPIDPATAQAVKDLLVGSRNGHFKCGVGCVGIVIGIVAAVVALANDYYLDYNACNNMIRNAGNQYVSAGIDCVNRASFTNSSGKVCRYKWEPLSNAANVIGGECTVQSGACVVDCS